MDKVSNNEDTGLKSHPVSQSSAFKLFSTLFSFILLFLLWAAISANIQHAVILGRKLRLCTRPPAVQGQPIRRKGGRHQGPLNVSVRHKTFFTLVDETNYNLCVTGSTKTRMRTETWSHECTDVSCYAKGDCSALKEPPCASKMLNWETYQPTVEVQAGFTFIIGVFIHD